MDSRPPAFLLYAADFMNDENVKLMTNQEVGCYFKLLCQSWVEGSIPSDVVKIAKLCGEDGSAMAQLWQAISPCWVSHPAKPDRLVNPRQEEERHKQETRRQERSQAGTRGAKSKWNKERKESANDGKADGSAIPEPKANDGFSLSLSLSSNPNEEAEEARRLAKEKCLAYVNRNFPNWALSGEKFRHFLAWEDKFPWEVILMAAEETMAAGITRLNYCESILTDWDEAGAYTVEAVLTRQAQKKAARSDTHEKRAPGGGRKPDNAAPASQTPTSVYDEIENLRPGGAQ